MPSPSRMIVAAFCLAVLTLAGCQKDPPVEIKPDYDRPLPPGADALRRITNPADWPDVEAAYARLDPSFTEALKRSLDWFPKPSTQEHFPINSITHRHAHLSVWAALQCLDEAQGSDDFRRLLEENFDCYTSVGWNDNGVVLYTGYYTPVYRGSRKRSAQFTHPLYTRPADLVTDPRTGKPMGRRRADGGLEPYPTRREIETSGMLAGSELVYLPTELDAYIIHVQGSAKIELAEGGTLYVGYAGKTDRPYVGLGHSMVESGLIFEENLSLPAIRRYFEKNPSQLRDFLYRNESYVFFREYDGTNWPAGSLGFQVEPMRSLATDKNIFPRAGMVLVNTQVGPGGDRRPFTQFMVDQDTGGAIRSAGRADIYMGIGPEAAKLAGVQYAEGRLYYFFLRADKYLDWSARFREESEQATTDTKNTKMN